MASTTLDNIQIVLVKTTHPGNIGACARAMKTMGLRQLALVNACDHLVPEAIARASGADDVLQQASCYDSLTDAIADCQLAVATSRRARNLEWPRLSPADAANTLIGQAKTKKVAIVFGRERDGLNNEELQLCRYHVAIPTSDEFCSLNLGQAVQLLAYECRKAFLEQDLPANDIDDAPSDPDAILADCGKVHGMVNHLETVMSRVEFLNPKQPRLLSQRLLRLFTKADLTEQEVNIMRGFLSSVENKIGRT